MEHTVNKNIEKFVPYLERPTGKWYLWMGVLFVIFLMGVYVLINQIVEGQVITGMRDYVFWGIYKVNFVIFLGFSYAGTLIGAGIHFFKIRWGHPISRLAEFINIIFLIIGPFFILFCMGRLDRLHYLFIYPRIQSPITWDVIAVVTDLIFGLVYIFITFIKDFARLRDMENLKIANWRKKIYRIFAFNYHDTPEQQKLLRQATNILGAILIPISIIAYSLLAWIFGMTIRPVWHSSIFAPLFVLTAAYSGIAMLIVVAFFYRKIYKLEDYITPKHFSNLGYVLLYLGLFYAYFTFSQYFTDWYNISKASQALYDKLFTFSEYGFMFWSAIGMSIIIPLIVTGIPKLHSIKSITLVSGLIIVGTWVKQYLLVVPTLETPFLPIQDPMQEWVKYTATLKEWVLIIAGFAAILMLFSIVSKLVPAIPFECTCEEEKNNH